MNLRAPLLSLLSLLSVSSLTLVACGGSEAAGTTPDASPDSGGSDAPLDAPGVDVADAPLDSPVARVPKNHRPAAITCAPSTSTGSSACAGTGGGPPGACKSDAECTAGTNGKCAIVAGGIFSCACSYDTCKSDAECTGGGPCACADSPYQGVSNGCAAAGNCKVDADCGEKGYCSPSGGAGCGGSLAGYYCHTTTDECIEDDDCKGTSGPTTCTFDTTKKHWACTPMLACA